MYLKILLFWGCSESIVENNFLVTTSSAWFRSVVRSSEAAWSPRRANKRDDEEEDLLADALYNACGSMLYAILRISWSERRNKYAREFSNVLEEVNDFIIMWFNRGKLSPNLTRTISSSRFPGGGWKINSCCLQAMPWEPHTKTSEANTGKILLRRSKGGIPTKHAAIWRCWIWFVPFFVRSPKSFVLWKPWEKSELYIYLPLDDLARVLEEVYDFIICGQSAYVYTGKYLLFWGPIRPMKLKSYTEITTNRAGHFQCPITIRKILWLIIKKSYYEKN